MNIISFSMPAMAYFNPKVYQLSFLDEFVFGVSHVLADQKFMAIFSMLFGASTILFIEGATKKSKRAGLLFYSRNTSWQLVNDYQFNRIDTFLNPEKDPLGVGYQITQSKIALGSGGLEGKGFMQGSQSQLDFLLDTHEISSS